MLLNYLYFKCFNLDFFFRFNHVKTFPPVILKFYQSWFWINLFPWIVEYHIFCLFSNPLKSEIFKLEQIYYFCMKLLNKSCNYKNRCLDKLCDMTFLIWLCISCLVWWYCTVWKLVFVFLNIYVNLYLYQNLVILFLLKRNYANKKFTILNLSSVLIHIHNFVLSYREIYWCTRTNFCPV